MKFSVFTVMTPDLKPSELAEKLKKYGYQGVEWRCKEIPPDAADEAPSFWRKNLCSIHPDASEEELETFRQAALQNGLEVVSVTPYLACGDLEGTEKVMRMAKKLGAPQIRVGVPRYDGTTPYPVLFDQLVAYLRGVQELSRTYGVRGVVETHHETITPSAGLAWRAVEKFDPDHIGVLFDPGNMVHEGYENYRMGLELLGPWLAHVHIKNAAWWKDETLGDGTERWKARWSPVHAGVVNWRQVLADLKAVGYDGYFGFEDFSGTFPTEEALRKNIDYIRSILT